ncbi:hypothetical protein CHELA20_52515 [Hyphomicrobiales bacterium]|nr:hypothetical protein CHELA20_52515 [Hyphomicrobiales bacterium]
MTLSNPMTELVIDPAAGLATVDGGDTEGEAVIPSPIGQLPIALLSTPRSSQGAATRTVAGARPLARKGRDDGDDAGP